MPKSKGPAKVEVKVVKNTSTSDCENNATAVINLRRPQLAESPGADTKSPNTSESITNANVDENGDLLTNQSPKTSPPVSDENVEHNSTTSFETAQNQDNGYATAYDLQPPMSVRPKVREIHGFHDPMQNQWDKKIVKTVENYELPTDHLSSKYRPDNYGKGDHWEITNENLLKNRSLENTDFRPKIPDNRNLMADNMPYPPEMWYNTSISGRQTLESQNHAISHKNVFLSQTGSRMRSNCDEIEYDGKQKPTSDEFGSEFQDGNFIENLAKEPNFRRFETTRQNSQGPIISQWRTTDNEFSTTTGPKPHISDTLNGSGYMQSLKSPVPLRVHSQTEFNSNQQYVDDISRACPRDSHRAQTQSITMRTPMNETSKIKFHAHQQYTDDRAYAFPKKTNSREYSHPATSQIQQNSRLLYANDQVVRQTNTVAQPDISSSTRMPGIALVGQHERDRIAKADTAPYQTVLPDLQENRKCARMLAPNPNEMDLEVQYGQGYRTPFTRHTDDRLLGTQQRFNTNGPQQSLYAPRNYVDHTVPINNPDDYWRPESIRMYTNEGYGLNQPRPPHALHEVYNPVRLSSRQGRTANQSRKLKSPVFKGQYSEWPYFKRLFLEAAVLNEWSEQETRYHLLSNLEGEARTFIISMDKQIEASSLSKIFAIMEHRFGETNSSHHHQALLESKSWKLGESLRLYLDEIRRLVSLAYPEVPSLYQQEALVRKHFVNGITDMVLKQKMLVDPPASVDLAVQYAERYVAAKDCMSKQKVVRMVRPAEDTDSEDESSDTEEFRIDGVSYVRKQPFQKKREKGKISSSQSKSKQSRSFEIEKVKCYNCGGLGHFKSSCPSPPLNLNVSSSSGEKKTQETKSTKEA